MLNSSGLSSSSLSSASLPSQPPLSKRALPVASFAALACSSAAFLSKRSFFHLAKDSSVTGVRVPVSLWRSDSRKSSSVRVLSGLLSCSAFSAARCSLVLSTKPGGRECRYMHLSPPFGHVQNQPYFPFSTASMKNLHTLSVVVLGLPCLLITTCRSFSSSQSSIWSFVFAASASSSRVSVYRLFFSPLRSTFKS